MKKQEYLTSELRGVPVYERRRNRKGEESRKRVGKVHRFVFHPHKRRVVGFTVKRPDVALMAHRSDLFVAIDSFDVEEGRIYIADTPKAVGNPACKRLGIDWDECTMWQGMPLLTEEGQRCGYVGAVRFATEDGAVRGVLIDRGAGTDLLLGVAELPPESVLGFRTGIGDALDAEDGDDFLHGGIIVAPEALDLATATEGGLAASAGAATAKAAHKVSETTAKVGERVKPVAAEVAAKAKPVAENLAENLAEKAKPVAENIAAKVAPASDAQAGEQGGLPSGSELAEKTGDAVNKGAYALGKQISKTRGMFGNFKEAYRRAANGEDE